jgi:cytoskeleton protein RodZ
MNVSMPPFSDLRDVGRMLRDTREAMGVSLEEVSSHLKIRQKYLVSLEKGEMGDIPGEVYRRGYLRVYAEYLGYDGQHVLQQMEAAPSSPAPQYLPPEKEEVGHSRMLALLASVLALLGFMLWQMRGEKDVTLDLVQPMPAAENFSSMAASGAPPTTFPELCETSGERLLPESVCRGDALLRAPQTLEEEAALSTIMELQDRYPLLPGAM